MKTRLIILATFTFSVILSIAQTTVTFSTSYAKGSAVSQILERAATDINKRTAGQVSLKISYNASQGTETAVVGKMRKGQIDGALLTAEGLKAINGGLQVLELPFLVTSPAEAKSIHLAISGTFEKMFSEGGFRMACWADPGIAFIYSRDPINDKLSLDALRTGVLISDMPGRSFFQKCRANCISVGEPEILPSLQTGSIIACYGTPADAVNLRWWTKLFYGMKDTFRYRSGAVVFRDGLESKLSPELFSIILAAFAAIEPDLENNFVSTNSLAVKTLEKSGIEFIKLSPAALSEILKTAMTAWQEKSGTEYPREVLEKAREILKK